MKISKLLEQETRTKNATTNKNYVSTSGNNIS